MDLENPIFSIEPLAKQRNRVATPGRRYYAKLSQTEELSDEKSNDWQNSWLLEAFSQPWFDENPPPELESPWADQEALIQYYSTAELAVLDLEISEPGLARFEPLKIIKTADDRDEESGQWFLIEAGAARTASMGPQTVPMTVYNSLYQPGTNLTLGSIKPVDKALQQKLEKATSLSSISDASEASIRDAMKHAEAANIDRVTVYDVGQGTSIGICDASGSVITYFDFGGGILRNEFTFPARLKNFCFSQEPPIILSHWDFDHWSSANRDPNSLKRTWIGPSQSIGPTAMAMISKIYKAGGSLLIVPKNFPATRYGQLYLERCSGIGRNHSGLALTVFENKNATGQKILLPGDARYNCVPSFSGGTQYLSVVAPHHGADMRNKMAPTCNGQSHARLVYSCGPNNTFGHPKLKTRQDHDRENWIDPAVSTATPDNVRQTDSRNASGFGHVVLSWSILPAPPPIPCGGGKCQLEPQQT